jgi:hypothetical protein
MELGFGAANPFLGAAAEIVLRCGVSLHELILHLQFASGETLRQLMEARSYVECARNGNGSA